MRNYLGNLLVLSLTLAICLLLAEFATRQIFDPVDFLLPELEDDKVLGHRIAAGSGGHDEWGFRNYERPASVDIVAIGDSQTYGISATSNQSWPAQLATISKLETYNMALGGYGALQYLHLLESRALELEPRTIIVGLYFGNDFLDSYNIAYSRAHWKSFRNTGLPIAEKPQEDVVVKADGARFLGGLRNWLASNSVIYRLLSQSALGDTVRDNEIGSGSRDLLDLNFDGIRQTFTPTRRLKAVDQRSATVQEGLRITRDAFIQMQSICDSRGIELLVALIPTKELVYAEQIERLFPASMADDLAEMIANEALIRRDLSAFLASENIRAVDLLPALRAGVAQSADIYPFNDGHPNGAGYAIIANEIYDNATGGLAGR